MYSKSKPKKTGKAITKLFDIPLEVLGASKLKDIDSQDPSLEEGFELLFEDVFEFRLLLLDGQKN